MSADIDAIRAALAECLPTMADGHDFRTYATVRCDHLRTALDALEAAQKVAAAPQQAAPAQPVARMHPDGRVIAEATYAHAAASGGASWSSVKDYTTPLYAAAQPMRQPLTDEHIDSMLPYVRSDQNVIGYGRAVARVVERAHGIGDAA